MGIVNVNDDSFSDDGSLDPAVCVRQAVAHAEAGADVIDVGAESARTNRSAIPETEEIARLSGFLAEWEGVRDTLRPRDPEQVWPPVLSINTWRPAVVAAVLERGVELINDMGGLPDARNARLAARFGAALLVMHTTAPPKVSRSEQRWDDVMGELERFFGEKLALARSAGMREDQLLIDPGIDFAKRGDDNLRIFRDLARLQRFGRPVLLPVSRKTVIGDVLKIADSSARDAGTIGCVAAGLRGGCQLFRMHNVEAGWEAIKVLWAVEQARKCTGLKSGAAARSGS